MTIKNIYIAVLLAAATYTTNAQRSAKDAQTSPAAKVNIFMGTSGDHGQLSPAASYPFSMLSIGPQTYPSTHTGYEYEAKRYLGFTHNRFEGVGCRGSGGNILIRPFTGKKDEQELIKTSQSGSPGYYTVEFTNKIKAEFTVGQKNGMHRYHFPAKEKGYFIDLSHTLANKFVAEEHHTTENTLNGWVEARTTCNVGTYKIYYYFRFSEPVRWQETGKHQLSAHFTTNDQVAEIRVGMSSVSSDYASKSVFAGTFEQLKQQSTQAWEYALSRMLVSGNQAQSRLFYSMLYRTLQSPYEISEKDGSYRGTNGKVQKSSETMYNGWAIWDNYRTQLPLLSVAYQDQYKGMVTSLAHLYLSGKKDYATQTEPTNTVRTEHAIVVLLDSYRKGFPVKFSEIIDSLVRENDRLDFSKPDKALESSYDTWALSEIFKILGKNELSENYLRRALDYKKYWNKDFKNLQANDVDKVQARNLYQGTIWQYRWFVPFDMQGLVELTGGRQSFIDQLDRFFGEDLYNHANEPDIQAPFLYNAVGLAWKSQELVRRFAADTVIQYYFNDNSKGIDPFVDRIYKNQPKAYIRTMDDDAGAMSAWYVLAASGFSPACPGWPVYYLNVPLLRTVKISLQGGKSFEIRVTNYAPKNKFIEQVRLNGKVLKRNYITQDEINAGGNLVITASENPVTTGAIEHWSTSLDNK